MKRFNKKFILIILLIGTFLLISCDKFNFGLYDASKEEPSSVLTAAPEDNTKIPTDSGNSTEPTDVPVAGTTITTENITPTPNVIQPIANDDLTVYVVNSDTADIEPVTAQVPKGSVITPELIVDTVKESMADQSISIGIEENGVTTQGDTVIVSFKKGMPPSEGLGSEYEGAILNAIAQSLIDNLKDYTKVIYRIEGQAYISGVYEYGIDEVYMGDN